jgi:hypothetical protein
METIGQAIDLVSKHREIMLAMITVTAYFCSLGVQIGYNRYFNIPAEFISLSPTIVFGRALGLFLIFVIIFGFLILISYIIVYIISFWPDSFNAIRESFLREYTTNPSMPIIWLFFNVYLTFYGPVIIMVLLVAFSTYLGKTKAKFKQNFHIVTQYSGLSNELAVIHTYGEYLITAPLIRDTNGNQIENKLYILKLDEMKTTALTLEKVGPLKVKESSNIVP